MRTLIKLILCCLTVHLYGADAANDLLITQRNSGNTGNTQRNITATTNTILGWNGTSLVNITAGTNITILAGVISATGGSGTPGGTNGQVQYNNSGAFGGFTLGGDATLNTATGVLTLATVNSTTGAFGSATQVATFTVNAKGLVTVSGNTTIALPLSALTQTGAAVNQVPTWNGSAWVPGAVGSGDVVGPASAVDTGVVRFNTTTGKLVQDGSGVTLSGSGVFAGGTYNHILSTNGSLTGSYTNNASTGTAAFTSSTWSNGVITTTEGGIVLRVNGTAFTTSGLQIQDAATLLTFSLGGGMVIGTQDSAPVIFAVNNAEVGRFNTSSVLILTNAGTTAGSAVTIDGTQTLTVKRITARVVTESDATSWTPAGDTSDVSYQSNSQSTGTLTVNAPSGTPTPGQRLILKIKSGTGVQTYSWNSIYVSGSDVTLPTASTASKIDNIGFLYDSVNSKWECVAVARGY